MSLPNVLSQLNTMYEDSVQKHDKNIHKEIKVTIAIV